MSNQLVVAGVLISASIIGASLIDARNPDKKTYGLSASSNGVYVVDRRLGRVRYCLSLADGAGIAYSKGTYRKNTVDWKERAVLKTTGFTEQEIADHVAKVEAKSNPDASYDDFPPFCTPWSSN